MVNLVKRRARGSTALAALLILAATAPALAQRSTRLAVLQAEDRRAPTAQDLATIRAAARSADPLTAQIGVRALGRLERPPLVADILPALRHRLPEVRAEAANAIAQAAQGLRSDRVAAGAAATLTSAQNALAARLSVEADADVRAAIAEALGRLPYTSSGDVARAEGALLEFASRAQSNSDRLGVARGFEALTRLHRTIRPPSPQAIAVLTALARTEGRAEQELAREARVRRLALESLIASGAADASLVAAAAGDPDAQVRRLAMRAASGGTATQILAAGVNDTSSSVRIEALRGLRATKDPQSCRASLTAAASDQEMSVALVAIDQLAICGDADDAVAHLVQLVSDVDDAEAPRNWHRAAHAIVALAAAAPERAAAALPPILSSRVWQLRLYGARASAALRRRDLLEPLAADPDDNVAEAAISALTTLAGHDADGIYVPALSRRSFGVVRAASLALAGTTRPPAIDALKIALARVESDARPGAADARSALRRALASAGVEVRPAKAPPQPAAPLNDADLRRLAAPRARFTIRDVGVFDVALFTMEAPATVLRFAQLAASGYYDGLTFHRVVPNGVIQGGSPDANEYSSDAPIMRDEVGRWPHVRGALGISTRGRDTGDGQIFVDLVDNPRYDHTYTVFAQVLNGLDVIDRILEGDVIDRVEILP